MAIQFARLQYVKRSKGQSSCHKSAYNARENIYDFRRDRAFNFSNRGDSAYSAVMLPEGVSERYEDISELWNVIESIEVREDAQVAKEMVLALPDDTVVTLEDKIAMTRGFLKEHFVDKGIICQVDIHEPHGNKKDKDHNAENWHAHVLMPTRRCEGEIFGLKARDLDVDVRKGLVLSTDKQWGVLWANYQNAYFKENGIELTVDPIGAVPEIHLGPRRMRNQVRNRVSQNEDLQKENAYQAQDERLVLQKLLARESVFNKKSVELFIDKHVPEECREDFLGRFWSSKEIVLVGEDCYTSRTVLLEEQRMMRIADRLYHKTGFSKDIRDLNVHGEYEAYTAGLSDEQKFVFEHICSGNNLSLISGRAGTGKSRVLCALRDCYQDQGMTVRGLAPTSAVADDMRQKGFTYASNLHSFVFREYHTHALNIQYGKEVWMIDEATMIPNPLMGEILQKAWRYNAKLVLVGDERQLHAIDRGGAFKAFRERFDFVSLESVVRQEHEVQRVISEEIGRGHIKEALAHMSEIGSWIHHSQESEAMQAMMNKWYEDYRQHPFDSFMILEYRNEFVREFNSHVHSILRARGEVGQEDILIYTARHGYAEFGVGDSIVFRSNDKAHGIFNGQRGVLIAASDNEFTVRIDDEKDITFDPQEYSDFQHGYAGTIHSSQGLTFDHVYVLHSAHMTQNLFYVANSRHRLSCYYFSHGDQNKVHQQIMRRDSKAICPEVINDDGASPYWLSNIITTLKDYMLTNHEFYANNDRYYVQEGVLISNKWEKEYLAGYRTLYVEDCANWPDLEGVSVRMVSKHKHLEAFLREQGVAECILIDGSRDESQLIGPYDRFYDLYIEYRTSEVYQKSDYDVSEMQFRLRLFALEKRYEEAPGSASEMERSRAYAEFICHEMQAKPGLLKEYGEHMTNKIIYHLEKTGTMPTAEVLQSMQERVQGVQQVCYDHQVDEIFIMSLEKEEQKQVQFMRQNQKALER